MAFEMAAHAPVNVDSINYKKYVHGHRGATGDGSTLWGVVAPLSLAGGGSMQLGFYNTECAAEERLRGYFRMLMDEQQPEAAPNGPKDVCPVCRDELANQEAHYGGCMTAPDQEDTVAAEQLMCLGSQGIKLAAQIAYTESREAIISNLREQVAILERAVLVENSLVGKLKKRYNVSETEIGELIDGID